MTHKYKKTQKAKKQKPTYKYKNQVEIILGVEPHDDNQNKKKRNVL